jgi:hypothetical protein
MVLCLPYVGIMALWWSLEAFAQRPGRRVVLSLGLLWFLLVFSVFQLFPPMEKMQLMLALQGSSQAAWKAGGGLFAVPAHTLAFFAAALCLGLVWTWALIRCHALLAATGMASVFFALTVDIYVYPLSLCHWYAVMAMLVAVSWIALQGGLAAGRPRSFFAPMVFIACLALMPAGFGEWVKEIHLPSSNLPEAETFFLEHVATDAAGAHTMSKVSPLLKNAPGARLWDPAGRRWLEYAVFDSVWYGHRSMSVDEAARIILESCPEPRPWMIFSSPWSGAEAAGYNQLIEFSKPTVYDEAFYFYRPAEPLSPR